MKKRNDPTPGATHWSQSRGSHDLWRDWRRNSLPLEDTNLSTRNTWIWSQNTQPHWRGQQMYDHKRIGSGQIQRVSQCSRTTWWNLHWRSKIDERVGEAAVIIRHFQNGETICHQLSKRLPNDSTIFADEATAITLALNYYRHMNPVQHDVLIYSDSMFCFQSIEDEDTHNPLICQIMNLLWALSDKGTRVRFCWVPSHCGIEGNEIVDQLAKETLDHDIDPLTTVYFADLKPLVNSYIQQEVQIKWDVSIHGRDLVPETNTRTIQEISAPD